MSFEAGTMIMQLFAFVVLFGVLSKYAFKPLAQMIETRQEQINEQIQNAENQRIEAEKLHNEHKLAMANAREEALEIVERARKQSEIQATEIITAARTESEQMLENAKKMITQEKESALAELRDQIGSLSVLIAAKIIEKDMDEAEHGALIDKYLKEVGTSV